MVGLIRPLLNEVDLESHEKGMLRFVCSTRQVKRDREVDMIEKLCYL